MCAVPEWRPAVINLKLKVHAMPQVANLEREVEWVLGELEEEREAGARHIKDAAARVREAEQAAARVKSMRKDDTKRLAKEKAALAERVVVSPPWQCHADCACLAEQPPARLQSSSIAPPQQARLRSWSCGRSWRQQP